MKKYALKTKTGEVINTTLAEDSEIAIEFFARIKNLTIKTLMDIYDVTIFVR